jgi:hypothetical protein
LKRLDVRHHIPSLIALFATAAIVAGPLQLWAQQLGHRVSDEAVTIDRRTEWAVWKVAGGTVEITDDGSVGPRFMRKNVNAALDATAYAFEADGPAVDDGPGGVYVGSNARDARFLIDGDVTTTWGPTPTRESFQQGDWWAEINLGRIVVASRIVLRFAEEGEGDPFSQFKVLAWRHPPTRGAPDLWVQGSTIPKYWELGRTEKPNKEQRVFEFFPDAASRNGVVGPESLIQANSGFEGDAIERVQIVVTDSDLDRAAELISDGGENGPAAQAKYEALDPSDQGAIEYYRQEPSGRETLITKEEYDSVNVDRRGRIRYFRREIPRLAEVEVWTAGDNLIIGLGDRGGKVEIEFPSPGLGWKDVTTAVSDAKYSTAFTLSLFRHFGPTDFVADLGAAYWVDTMHFLNDGVSPIEEFAVDISDGTLAPDGSIKWTRVAGEVTGLTVHVCRDCEGNAALKFRQFEIEPTLVRFLRGTMMTTKSDRSGGGSFGIPTAFTDFMLYGEGFVPQVVLESDLINLSGNKNLNTIEWEVAVDPGTSVQLQTRSGNELIENLLYFDSDGNPIEPVDDPVRAKRNYERKPSSKQGEIRSFFSAGGDWSSWSRPYGSSGETVTSPSPREYMQIRAILLSDSPLSAASLHTIKVNLSDPVANRLVGEVWPTLVAEIAKPQDLSFYVRPFFGSSSQQFDELRIEATGGTVMEFVEARIGSDDDFARGEPTLYLPAAVEVMSGPHSTIQFRLPEPIDRGVDLLEIRFRSTTFSTNTDFRASCQNSSNPGLWQRVDAGNATDLVNSQTTAILALEGNQVITDLAISTPVMTPNEDGVNDVMSFDFNVARINSQQTVRVTIFDLSGAVVKEISDERSDPRGPYAITWLGDDAAGSLVPPGIYLVRIDVDVDSGSATTTSVHRLVQVAY